MSQRKNYDRVDRVSKQIHQIIGEMFLRDVNDPKLRKVQITDVEVSGDLQVATIYYVVMDDRPEPSQKTLKRLERATSYFRKQLGQEMSMRRTPELRFKYDKAVAQGRRIENLLSTIDIPAETAEEE